jgi:hypothetical protein
MLPLGRAWRAVMKPPTRSIPRASTDYALFRTGVPNVIYEGTYSDARDLRINSWAFLSPTNGEEEEG